MFLFLFLELCSLCVFWGRFCRQSRAPASWPRVRAESAGSCGGIADDDVCADVAVGRGKGLC